MPAVIEPRDTRAFHAASAIWGYCRDNARSLDSQRHIEQVQAAIEKAMRKERDIAERVQQENESLKWLLSIASNHSTEAMMKQRREGKMDAKIREGYHKRKCTVIQLAGVFRCNQDTIRSILKLNLSRIKRDE